MTLESFWNLLYSKFVSLGVLEALLGVAPDFARKSEWKNAVLCGVGATGIWLVIKVARKISPRIDKLLDWIFGNAEKFALDLWGTLTSDFETKY